jgi:tRNA (guanine26-N2/guanine27-N2)-dimethyltransferase
MKRNAKDNKLTKKCSITEDDASLLMRKNVFDAIDLDPFGSPNTFIDSAARSIYHKGFMCVTATDQSALAGTYPDSCFRKYGIRPIRSEFYNELGVRILLSFVIQNLARYDKAFVPLLCFSDRHYYKVFGKVEHAGSIANLLKDFGYANYCPICGDRKFGKVERTDSNGHQFNNCGMIYLGNMNDKAFCEKVLDGLRKRDYNMKKDETRLLETIIEESDMPAFYYDIHYLSKKLKKETPRFETLIRKLKDAGFRTSRTHFCLTALKTDADFETMVRNF